MSTTIDERVVEMRFDNRQFEAGVKTSLSTLDKLKEGLDLDGAAKGLKGLGDAAKKCDLSTLSNSIETVRMKFSALEVMAVTALSNITNSVINTGKRMIESFTLEPVKQGFDEYELKMGSIQTIMMSTGASLEEVNKYLQELNTYSDKTIYSFQDMTSNIGKFTNAGVGLEDAVMAIQGVSNVAAVSGANANEASRAMYNFAQALSAGYVKLIDWKSIENANMATVEFKTQLLESAVACGTLTKTADGMYKTVKGNVIDATHNFNDSLQDQWMTTEALVGTLRNYADETTDIGKKAFAAAQDVKTFSQLMDTLKEAAGSGWANTWEILFGDFEEAKELWTGLSQAIGGFIDTQSDARNSVLQGWKDLGGRTELIESLKNTLKGIGTVIKPITEAFRDIFPPTTAEQLHNLTEGLLKFTEKLTLSDTASENLKNTFKGLFAILDICKQAIGAILGPVGSLLGKVTGLGGGVLGVTGSIGEWLVKLDEAIKKNDIFGKGIEKISDFVSGAVTAIKNFAESVREYLGLPTLDEAKESLKELFGTAKENIQVPGLELLHTILEKLKERASQVKDAIVGLKDGISDAFSKIGGNTDVSKFATLIQALSVAAKKIGGGIFDVVGNGINKIVTAVSNADFSGIIDLLNGISIGGIAIAITKFTNSLTKPFDEVGGLLDNVKGILDGVRGCFEAYQTQLKAGTLLKIASAIAILAASIVAISLIDSEKLSASLGAITVLFAELMASMSVFTKISGDVKGAVKSSTVMLAMSTSILILASALKKIGDLDGGQLAKGVAGVTALMAAMVGAVKLLNMSGGSSMKGATQMVLFSASIKILASVCTDLATLEWNGLAKGLTGVGVLLAEVSLFMNTAKFSGKSLTTAAGIVILASAIKILASACKDLGSLDFGQLVKGLGSIGVLLAEITVFTKLTGDAKGLVSTGIAMIGIGAAIIAFCGVIAQGAPAIGEAVKAVVLTLVDVLVECVPAIADGALALLSGVLASLANYTPEIVDSVMLFLINLLNGIAERLPELIQAAVNVIAAFFSGIIDALAGLDTSVLVKTIAGIGLLSGIMVALGAVAALIPSAMIGVLGMGALIAELAIVLAAVGALAQIPGLSWLIGEGGKLLEQIGTAIGGFVGGIVGGFMSGISSQFPQIGSDLAAFMTNVQPFIDGASSISPAMFSGVQALTDAILLLTKAELVQGIASWFTGSSSLSDFADELVPFGESMAEFSNAISGMDADLVSKAATAGKALAEMATTLPNSGGVVGFFAGENDMDKFGEQLVPFGKAMKDYSLAVKGMDVGAVSNSASAGKALVELSNTIPNCGGLVSFFTGDNSIADFGDQLVLFGNGLAAYSASIESINMSKLSGAITQVEKLVALADTVKNMDQYAFVNFTNALVLLANTSIQNFTDAFYNSGATVSTAVIYMLNSAGTTIRQNQTIVNVAMAELMLAMAATVKAHTTSMNTAVVQMMVGFSTTIRSNGASVRTAMQSVMLIVVAEVNNYKDQFNEAGRNVSQGFINGIRSKLSGASQAGRDLGLAALNAAKKALDSHSPSREFIELGKNIGEGMTIGINNAIVPVSSAAAKMSDEAIKVAQKGLDSFKDWAEERKYYSELSLKEELAGWETLQKKYREGSEERKQIDREVYRVQNELVTATYQYSMNWIEEQKSYNKLTLAEELAAYKRVQSRYAKGTELRKKLDLQVYQLEKEISDAQKQYISDVQSVQSEANQKRLDLEEEYADKVKSINAQLASDIQAENDKYENALKSREDSLYKSYGLFDAVKERDEVSGDTLMKNLEGQVKEFGEWQDILESLAGRGLDSDLIEELQDMGPDAIAQIKALNNMSDSELEKYADLWKVKHAMAREQAVGELEGLREETQQNIAKLREEADQELTEYRALWQEKMNQVTEDANAQLEQLRRSFEEKVGLIKNNTEDELQEMADTAQKVLTEAGWDETGKQIVKGLTEGVQSEKSSFVDEITQLALAGVQAAKSTLDIHSPSRVFREIGNYTGLGFVKGLQDYVDRSYAAGSEMAESAEGGLSGVLQTIADIVSGGFDIEPVIRPVLDLSAVSAGADALNNLFYSQRAVGLVGQAAVAFEAQRSGSSQTTISVDNDDVVAELRTLRGEMASMLERMEKLRVVLNTGALVGELAEPMDVALGQRSTQRGRGI